MSLLENIKAHEGFSARIYKDSVGKPTVGYGFLVAALSPDELKLNGGKVEPMSKEVAEKILNLETTHRRQDTCARVCCIGRPQRGLRTTLKD